MANNYFQFKQFTIYQDLCSMKVCTDACLLGAYAANKMDDTVLNVLDIGTGTGLLALMLAQKTNATIDALEVNTDAAKQATENVQRSPWKERVKVYNSSVQDFEPEKKYDLIISNPPFFEGDLRSANKQKNEAKHDSTLTLKELADGIVKNLSEDGIAVVLLPYHRTDYFGAVCEPAGLFATEILKLKQSPHHAFFRSIVVLSKQSGTLKEDSMFIHDEQRQYSAKFTALLKDYYLKL